MSAKKKRKSDDIVFLPLGGCDEIGMNVYLYGRGKPGRREWLMIDLGLKFGDERTPGVDVILPDLTFIAEQNERLAGIVLTHAHEDHYGAVPYLWEDLEAPVYATPFTCAMLRTKLSEAGLLDVLPLHEVELGSRFDVGGFDVQLIDVTHSIPEANAVLLRTPHGHIVHTGDWKIDPEPITGEAMDEAAWRVLGKEGCRALICDSTNVLRDGVSPSEAEVGDGLCGVIENATGRVGVTTFASNVGRVISVARAAARTGREFVVAGRALHRGIEAARETGHWPDDMPKVLDQDQFGYLPREKVVCLCTGSQGERRAALSRVAEGSHPEIAFDAGDTLIFSSRTIPGNEKAVSRIHNLLALGGVQIVTADDALVHVTGHPRRGELQQIYDWLQPELLVPMHGEARHLLEQAVFGRRCGIPETMIVHNGEIARLAPGPAKVVDEAPAGTLHVDGRVIETSEDGAARIRRKLSFGGLVSVALVVDKRGNLVEDPLVNLMGLPRFAEDGTEMEEIVLDLVEEVFVRGSPKDRRRPEFIEDVIYRGVRRAVDTAWGKKPGCQVFVHVT